MDTPYTVIIGAEEVRVTIDGGDAGFSGNETLKQLAIRIQIGTLIKTDNESFLLGGGCSMSAGGVSVATVPPRMEHILLRKGVDGDKVANWLAGPGVQCLDGSEG